MTLRSRSDDDHAFFVRHAEDRVATPPAPIGHLGARPVPVGCPKGARPTCGASFLMKAAAGCIAALCFGLEQAPPELQYYQAVQAYRQGERNSAFTSVLAMGAPPVEQAIAALSRGADRAGLPDSWSPADLEAAVVLHSDLAALAAVDSSLDRAKQLAFARRLAAIGGAGKDRARRGPALSNAFVREWHLLLARQAQGILELDEVDAEVETLKQDFAASADILLTAGTLSETLAWPALRDSLPRPLGASLRGRKRPALLRDAEDHFRGALALDSHADEARLRLGRVLCDQGRYPEALPALELVLEQSKDSWVLYLGRLFAGAACERLNRRDEAEAHYQHATELRPDAQSAMVALSFVRQRAGRIRGATDALLPLAKPAVRAADDPWWEYYFGQWRHVSPTLAEMRKVVQK